mgnify:CR=1 FL=1
MNPEPAIIVQVGGIPMLIVTGMGPWRYQCVAIWSMCEPGEIWKLE